MKTKSIFGMPLIAGLGLILAGRLMAQTYTNIYSFTISGVSPFTNSDGANPKAALILSGNSLYGTACEGGSSGNGTVFKVNTDRTGFTNLYSFSGPYNKYHNVTTNDDGANPQAALILSGNTLYGTTFCGGSSGKGTVFAVNTDGTGFTNLHSFTNGSDGARPAGALILAGNTLYGTASSGGISNMGTVFAISTDGTKFTNLHSFAAAFGGFIYTNSEGANPYAGLVLSSNTLYGTAERGGSSGIGTVFRVNTDGTCFTNLYNFSSANSNTDGQLPSAGLVLSGHTLYGNAESGGSSGAGTVFTIKTDGTGFTNLHSFTTTADTNNDGGFPLAGLILSGDTLYGTLSSGGGFNGGTVFAIKTDGTCFTNLYSFGGVSNGGGFASYAGLILSGNALYGTTTEGGGGASGTVFSLTLPPGRPLLTITRSGANAILTWSTNSTLCTLQSTTNLGLSPVWTANSSLPVVLNGQNTVTNPITGTQQYFRLSQ